jgi:hypothetical protein
VRVVLTQPVQIKEVVLTPTEAASVRWYLQTRYGYLGPNGTKILDTLNKLGDKLPSPWRP